MMKHIYKIDGMTCNGCKEHVEKTLHNVKGVLKASVNLENAEAIIEMDEHIPLEDFMMALSNDTGNYSIHLPNEKSTILPLKQKPQKVIAGNGIFYCPMHCEGNKTYDKSGNCPVCGMDLVQEVSVSTPQGSPDTSYTCPMHPDFIQDGPGACPKCGMDLVPKNADVSAEEKTYKGLLNKLWVAAVFTLPIFVIAMSEMIADNPLYELLELKYWNWIQLVLSIPVVFYATWMFFTRAYRSVITWNLNMFTLIGIGAGVAWLFSLFGMVFPDFFPDQFKTEHGSVHVYFEAATVILTLVLMGQVLEARAHSKTNDAVKELLKLAPNKAIRVANGQEEEIAVDAIQVGDMLRVKPGDKIPVDGIVTEGHSTIDESMISGEPVPVEKSLNDKVSSGTINGNQSFLMKAEKVGADTLLSQIIHMVNNASRSKAPIQKIADQVSSYFVPTVVVISVLTYASWIIWGPQPVHVYALVNAIAVLIIACPCALGLATPMSVMVGVGKGAQNGVLIKNAEALEKMNKVNTLVIDKTGTVTEGKPTVQTVVSFDSAFSEKEVLTYIVAINQKSEHPLAQATVNYGKEKAIAILNATDFNSETGKGVSALINTKKVALGNDKMMNHANAIVSEDAKKKAEEYQKQGKTVSYISLDGQVIGCVVIGDKIKKTSANAIKELQDRGVNVIMLTGDNFNTAQAVAKTLNLADFKAGMLPEDKLNEVKKLQGEGLVVAMAGDGINDAPALAQSDIGIAMGTGTDVAIESASITLVKGDLHGIVKAHNLSVRVMKNIKQNLFFALIYNTLGIPVAAGLLYPIFGILLSPMIAALAMSFSSVSVIANALRLKVQDIN